MKQEYITKAKAAKTAEELITLAKENGMEMTAEEAQAYFDQLNKSGALADEELDNVAGGACYKGGKMITTIFNDCYHWVCTFDGSTWQNCRNFGRGYSTCKQCGSDAVCQNCKYCSYEKGLWLCNNPVNMK